MLPSHEERLERAADALRIRWGIHNQLCPDVVTMIYKLKSERLISDFSLVPDVEMPEMTRLNTTPISGY